jgi:putrescine aminotransferase
VADKNGPVLFDNPGRVGTICRDHAIEQGLMMRAVRDGMILSPPLTFTRDDIDASIRMAHAAMDATLATIGR